MSIYGSYFNDLYAVFFQKLLQKHLSHIELNQYSLGKDRVSGLKEKLS